MHRTGTSRRNSAATIDGDYGEEQITLRDPRGFDVGCGIAIWDDRSGGFHTTVARIIGRKGNTLAIDRPLQADYMVAQQATAATVFPVVSGARIEGARVTALVIENQIDADVPSDDRRPVAAQKGHEPEGQPANGTS